MRRMAIQAVQGLALAAVVCITGAARAVDYSDVRRAHEAYLRANFAQADDVRTVMVAIKTALMNHPGDAIVLQNLLQLNRDVTERGYSLRDPRHILMNANGHENLNTVLEPYRAFVRAQGEIIPLDWSLPPQMAFPVIGVSKTSGASADSVSYALTFWSSLTDAAALENVRLVRYPSTVVLDKKLGIGRWGNLEGASSRLAAIKGSTMPSAAAPQEGLYLLDLQVRGQAVVHGWIILSDMTSRSVPEIVSPRVDETFQTEQPEFLWRDFHSAQYRSFEQRKLQLGVTSEGATDSDQLWRLAVISPDFSHLAFGRAANGHGADRLESGRYVLSFGQEERWLFGGLLLARTTRYKVPFSVVP